MNMQELMDFIGTRYIFSVEYYPVLQGKSADETRVFAINHSHLHMSKSLGRLAAESERYDHGGSIDNAVVKEVTVKMLINVLKLAQELGMTADELIEAVPNFMISK